MMMLNVVRVRDRVRVRVRVGWVSVPVRVCRSILSKIYTC